MEGNEKKVRRRERWATRRKQNKIKKTMTFTEGTNWTYASSKQPQISGMMPEQSLSWSSCNYFFCLYDPLCHTEGIMILCYTFYTHIFNSNEYICNAQNPFQNEMRSYSQDCNALLILREIKYHNSR